MEIVRQYIYRYLSEDYKIFINPYVSNFKSKDDYDNYLHNEINNIGFCNFIKLLKKDIDIFFINDLIIKENIIKYSYDKNSYLASIYKILIFDLYISNYLSDTEINITLIDDIKDELLIITDFIFKYYNDSNKIALSDIKKFYTKYLLINQNKGN